MKKIISILLTVLMAFAFFCPAVWADADNGPEKSGSVPDGAAPEVKPLLGKDALERAITLFKAKVAIPAEYESFTNNVYDSRGKTVFNLQWSTDRSFYTASGGSISATVDEDGNIINYNNYRYNRDMEYKRRLPAITRAQAFELARKFIGHMCPDLMGQLAFGTGEKKGELLYDGSYSYSFSRQYKGIPYNENNVSIEVDGQTGDIRYFTRNWSDGLTFPEPTGAMSLEAAKPVYIKQIPLELKYKLVRKGGEIGTQLEYAPQAGDMNSGMDAFTGEKLAMAMSIGYNPYYGMASREETLLNETRQSGAAPTELEADELKRLQGFIAVESAEKLARGIAEFGIDDAYRLNRYNYLKSENGKYILSLEFMKTLSKEDLDKDIPEEKLKAMMASGVDNGYATIAFDAKTSELLEFNSSRNPAGGSVKTPPDQGETQKRAEAFLRKYKAGKYPDLKLSNLPGQPSEYMMKYGMPDPNSSGSVTFVRMVNGIPFEDNRIVLSVDSASGKITYYSETWSEMIFPPANNIIEPDKAYEILFAANPLTLKYVTFVKPDEGANKGAYAYGTPASGEIKLVCGPDITKPLCLDAQKGVLLNYGNGEVYREPAIPQYNDIGNHAARLEITALAEAGILPGENSFRPRDAILQKEFLLMISKLQGSYSPDPASEHSEQQMWDSMYRVMLNQGIVNEDEKAPDEVVTRENAVKYLLRSAGYKKFAEMEGIFSCDYSDKGNIDPKLTGYATLAKSLKLVDGASFGPKEKLSRAEAAILLYRYMKN